MLWMTAFHLCFDLAHFGLWSQDFYRDPVWTVQRNCIVALFLMCAGMGQALACSNNQTWRQFWRRWLQIAGCAALVSVGSSIMFPNSFIYFGVLHALCVMLPLARWLGLQRVQPGGLLALAAGFFAVWLAFVLIAKNSMNAATDGQFVIKSWQHWLNSKPGSVLGLVTQKPITEDHVPLMPWLAAVLAGLAVGQWLAQRKPHLLSIHWAGRATPLLAKLGQWSLSYYMLHQPVLIGLLLAASWCAGWPVKTHL